MIPYNGPTVPSPDDALQVHWRPPVRTLGRLASPTIERLASASLPDSVGSDVTARVGRGVARKVSLMPMHVCLVVLVLTCVFGLLASLRAGRGVDAVRAQAKRWVRSPLALLRDTMLLYQRLARFQYHSLDEASETDDAGA
jgi:hypothetical protein